MNPLLEDHRDEIRALARRYGVTSVRVFGSMARGEATPESDVDLLVDVPEGVSGFQLGAMLMDLQDLLGRRVELVTERSLHPRIKARIMKEVVTL
jgi:hypothetical protein